MANEEKEEKQTVETPQAQSQEQQGAPEKQEVPPETQERSAEEPLTGEPAEQKTQGDEPPQDSADAQAKAPEKEAPDPRDEKIRELNDRLLRQMAEFDNFRRRTEKEKSMMFETGASSVIEKFLPIVDNFERAMATVTEEQKADPFVTGMDKIYKQMLTMLEQLQVTPIEALGKEFDPQLHNAVMHVEDESYGEGEVIEEFQKGYKYRDSVVRHSMVKVAN